MRTGSERNTRRFQTISTRQFLSASQTQEDLCEAQGEFSPLNDKAQTENWTGKFKDDGSLNTSFTLYGHMYSGSPNKLEIFAPDADMDRDEPVETIEFKVTPPSIEIVISEKPARLTSLVTQRSSDEITSGLLVEDEYKSYHSENLFPLPMEHMLSQHQF